jgi:phosphate binding protein
VIGKNLLHYEILEKIGAGGQGAVYKARDTKLGRTVVVKVLPPDMTVTQVNLKRFEREAQLASSLDHANICTIFDLGEADGVQFIAMQHVEGKNVRELVNGAPLELASAISIAIQVCDALIAAHQRGIIHRDIKANNVMVLGSGQVKVLDFGLAKLLDAEVGKKQDIDRTQLTEVGVPYGTATYAAPEQAQGLDVDERADIFSTGVLLYEMLTGTWPFRGKSTVDVRYAVVHGTPRALDDARPEPTPPELQRIVDRALAKNPRDRYQSVVDMRDDLRNVLHAISLMSDPTYVPDLTSMPPRYLGGNGFGARVRRRWRKMGPEKYALAGIGALALIALIALPIWYFAGRRPAVAAATSKDNLLRISGSNTIGAQLAPALAEAFLKNLGAKDVRTTPGAEPEETLVMGVLPGESSPQVISIRSHGSATAFTDLAADKCDIGLSSRRIKPDEAQTLAPLGDLTAPASEHIVALDGVAIVVNSENPIESLTKEQVAKIFSGEITSWSQLLSPGGQIKIYARDDKSGTFDSFKSLVLGNSALSKNAVRFEDSNNLSEAVAGDRNGIGFIGLPYVKNTKSVAISEGEATPFVPNRLTVATEDYLLSRRLYLYTAAKPDNPWVAKFLEFALAKSGQDVVDAHGFIAQTVQGGNHTVAKGAPNEYKQLTDGAERLSLNFRFRPGGKELDNKARLDLDRVADFVTGQKLSGQNLLLFGFSDQDDGKGAGADISAQRADAVAEQLKRRGVTPLVVKGFGSALAVASNETDEGREKNRRVEIWLKQ